MVKKLSAKDKLELAKFEEYLADVVTMSKDQLYRKYQKYLMLSDSELELLIKVDLTQRLQ